MAPASPTPSSRTRAWAVPCASAAAILGGLGLAGWATPWRGLASLTTDALPIAPSTALAVLFLSATLILEVQRPSHRRTVGAALLVSAFAGLQLGSDAFGLPSSIDARLVPHPGLFGNVPTGRMSPLTGFALLCAGLSLLFITLPNDRRTAGATGASLALVVSLLGGVGTLGYLFGAPLLYGGTIVPMAFSTAMAIGALGLALVALAPRHVGPLKPFSGPTVRAQLLRAFLPVAPAILAAEALIDQVEGLNPALDAALTALVSALMVAGIGSYMAARVAGDLERAQRERDRSRGDADRLVAVVQSSEDAIYAQDLSGTITAWNAGAERLFGYSLEEAVGRSARLLWPPGAEGEWTEMLASIGAGDRSAHKETHRRCKDGSLVLVSSSASPLGNAAGDVIGASVIVRDVSEQRRAEQARQEHEKALRVFFESDVAGILFGDARGVLQANAEFFRITGYAREDLEAGQLLWSELTPPEFSQGDETARREALARGACRPYEKQYVRKDGTRTWVMVSYAILDRETERSVGFVVSIEDRKEAEVARRQSERRFERIFQSHLLAIAIAETHTGRLIDVNERLAEFFGYTPDEMIGRTVFELGLWASPADRAQLVAAASTTPQHAHIEATFRRKSGEIRPALASMEIMTLAGIAERLNLVVLVDLSERKQLELQLLQSQKMEAVGRLAGGVAHDFNNLLGVILGNAELLSRTASTSQHGKLEQVLKAAQRAASLTRQLLAFSRKQVVEPRVLDLNALLADLQKMLGRLIGEDVDFAIVPGLDLGRVKADPGQLEQVVINLCVNARDAMPDGGLLRIHTANVEVNGRETPRQPLLAAGRYVSLAVADTGCGIESELLSRIFEPFFTTKEAGKGTGLGLATVYGIVKQSGGSVWVESELGRGTTFRIYLPRVEEGISPLEAHEVTVASRSSETILLVEDEASLRFITREILEEQGYRVMDAAGAGPAMELARVHPEAIDLLLTDVVMPGLNGRQLADTLVATRPSLRVLYMSGYTDEVVARSGVLETGTSLLAKPFTAEGLLRRVREALERPDTRGPV